MGCENDNEKSERRERWDTVVAYVFMSLVIINVYLAAENTNLGRKYYLKTNDHCCQHHELVPGRRSRPRRVPADDSSIFILNACDSGPREHTIIIKYYKYTYFV